MAMISGKKAWLNSLAEAVRKTPDSLYFTMLVLYLLSMLLWKVSFTAPIGLSGRFIKEVLTDCYLVCLGVFLVSVFFRCIRNVWAMLPVSAAVVLFLLFFAGMQANNFNGCVIVVLAAGAYGRDYGKILKLYLWCMAAVIILAGIGVLAGFAKEVPKVGAYGKGLSFGFIHANFLGIFVMITFCLAWYIFAKNRAGINRKGFFALSWVLAWALGVFTMFVPKCRTAALLLFLFPLLLVFCGKLIGDPGTKKRRGNSNIVVFFVWILILLPFLCYLITVIVGTQREWLVVHTFGTYIENFSKRFIQGGLAFKEYGFPLTGKLIRFPSGPAELLGNYRIRLYILDNAYAAYTVFRGMIWMVPAMLWVSYANLKMVQRKDYNLLTISVLFCLMGLMERFPFDIHNFVLLYPLASASGSGINAKRRYRTTFTEDCTANKDK